MNRDPGIVIVDANDGSAVGEIASRLARLAREDVVILRPSTSEALPLTEVPLVQIPRELRAKRPPAHWDCAGPAPARVNATAWRYAGLLVLSELSTMEAPDGKGDAIPQWLISISKGGKRPSDRDVARVLEAFDMVGAEEDNHGPGISRHFFLVVDPARRVECECKTDETVVTEPDGYRWSTPKDGPCSGCEYAEITGKPCPVHGGTT